MKQSWRIIEEKRILVGHLFIVEMHIVHVSKTPSQHITGIRLDLLGQGSFLCVHTCVCDLQTKNYYPYPSIQKKNCDYAIDYFWLIRVTQKYSTFVHNAFLMCIKIDCVKAKQQTDIL